MRRMGCNIGIYNLHMQTKGGGEKLALVLAEHLSLKNNVWLFCAEPLDIPSLEQFFGVDLRNVTVSCLNSVGPFMRAVAKVRGRRAPAFSLHHYLQLKQKFNLDIFINNNYASGLVCPAPRGIFMCMFPHPMPTNTPVHLTQRLRSVLVEWIEKRITKSSTSIVDSYSTLVAISEYTAHWIRRMWGRDSEIIYPPCEDMGPPGIKRNVILNVGRFVAARNENEQHHKRQELLIDAFKQMTDLHRGGWELHFAGSMVSDEDSHRFGEDLRQKAGGLPIFFHFNAAREEIRDLYRRASIYWHATGFGFDAERYPAKQEHFGMATVEAMSAGAVPVVYSSGGQKEIVSDDVDGFCWDHLDELMSLTRRLADDAALRVGLSRQAVLSSKRFGREAFVARVDKLIGDLRSPQRSGD